MINCLFALTTVCLYTYIGMQPLCTLHLCLKSIVLAKSSQLFYMMALYNCLHLKDRALGLG